MTRTSTLRLSEEAYNAAKRYAEADHASMNGWIEAVLDGDTRALTSSSEDPAPLTVPGLRRLGHLTDISRSRPP